MSPGNLQVMSPAMQVMSPGLQGLSPGMQGMSPVASSGLPNMMMSPAAPGGGMTSAMSPAYLPDSSSQPVGTTTGASKLEEFENDDPNICRWIDCNMMFKEKDELVRHLEKVHIDQKKGDEFTCFWQGCSRRLKTFNARYKLLIHMRVHSGEKPNKCTVSDLHLQITLQGCPVWLQSGAD